MLLHETRNPKIALFTLYDIKQIFKMGIGEAVFSLDQPNDTHFHSHPFQKMRYGPNRMTNSLLLLTMFHCDYILKMITQRTGISANAPFKQQDVFKYGILRI